MRISVTNIGPVRQASIGLKPLVIFVGPNNSGKSYVATAMYASLSQTGVATSNWMTRSLRRASGPRIGDEAEAEFSGFFTDALDKKDPPPFDAVPQLVRNILQSTLTDSLLEYSTSVAEEISRTAGVSWPMVRRVSKRRAAKGEIEIASDDPQWAVRLEIGARAEPKIELAPSVDLADVWSLIEWQRVARLTSRHIFREISSELIRICLREIPSHSKYLPAARSGILQSHKALAGSLMRRATLTGIEDLRVPAMSGVVTDFLSEMIELSASESGDFAQEALALEDEILHGKIELAGDPAVSPEVVYSTPGGEYSLGRTSSMVSELAPVVLYLRHRLRRNDLLFIEEPEAHLHPGTQIVFARSLVRLVNLGLRIVLTTHSEFFLQQINNAIVAGGMSGPEVAHAGFSAQYGLPGNKVAAYFFQPTQSGTMVSELPIGEREGIAESSFSSVSEHLYNEAVALDRSGES